MSIATFTPSLYEPYRSRLALLADESVVGEILNHTAVRHGWWDTSAQWSCTYGRFFPGGDPYVLLVFATKPSDLAGQSFYIVRAYNREVEAAREQERLIYDANLGWLSVMPFGTDERLTTIATVLSQGIRPVIVRYRPGKRCTVRFEGENGGLGLFAKIFPDDRGRRLHADAAALWDASCAGTIAVAVPQSLRWDEQTRTLWQREVSGSSVHRQLAGSGGPLLAQRMGQALGSIARSELAPHATFHRDDQWQETRKQGIELCRRVPWLAGAIDQLLRELARLHSVAPVRPLRPIHGAPHAHQWLYEGEKLGLVDFDGFANGDCELDLATFISEIDFEKRSALDISAINSAFLTGYESVAGQVDLSMLQAYCVHKRLSKALKLAYAIHPEGDTRTEQAVDVRSSVLWVTLNMALAGDVPTQGVAS